MAEASSTTSNSATTQGTASQPQSISPSLKFIISHLKTLVPNQLTSNNYPIWRHQILKLLRANGFEQFLESPIQSLSVSHIQQTGEYTQPTPISDQIDIAQNLAAAICSTVSPSILPYILHLDSLHEIWQVLETRFHSSNRSKVIQLKNELHDIAMGSLSMAQYLTDIKKLVDQIASTGSTVDNEDIILHILNGLPSSYQSFKTSIRTMLHPISLDTLYALLISEEIHVQNDASKLQVTVDSQTALYTRRDRGRHGRGRQDHNTTQPNRSTATSPLTCQICNRRGHTADVCWHRLNTNYVPVKTVFPPRIIRDKADRPGMKRIVPGRSIHIVKKSVCSSI
ncbi:hypothetical protein KFK09_027178 [Dendrobium nobile]|uniref:Retrovirus-related Pol polyprotein from transposon TNT 1-94 n=1 Tax=Dendrobium nobile TaxID=94219 RepID=A0A8T3AAT2_DENNO|nr:hypothetical protein KFK09_027178 [Dendrobium nobile]